MSRSHPASRSGSPSAANNRQAGRSSLLRSRSADSIPRAINPGVQFSAPLPAAVQAALKRQRFQQQHRQAMANFQHAIERAKAAIADCTKQLRDLEVYLVRHDLPARAYLAETRRRGFHLAALIRACRERREQGLSTTSQQYRMLCSEIDGFGNDLEKRKSFLQKAIFNGIRSWQMCHKAQGEAYVRLAGLEMQLEKLQLEKLQLVNMPPAK